MSVEKWWNEICGRRKREKLRERHTQTPIRSPRNPHGWTWHEFGTQAVGGERLTICAKKSPNPINYRNEIGTQNYYGQTSWHQKLIFLMHVLPVASSVKTLLSKLTARVRFPKGSWFWSLSWDRLCVLCVLSCPGDPDIVLTTIFREVRPCVSVWCFSP